MNLEAETLKHTVLGGLALAGSALANVLGGWDAGLQTLAACMGADYLTGLLVAGVFHHSEKTDSGTLDSRAGFKGLCKKGAILLVVLVAARLDALLGVSYARMAVVLFFIGNEGISILENLGLMGVPYPAFLKNALAALQEKGEKGAEEI